MRSAWVHSCSRIFSHYFNLKVHYTFHKSPYFRVFSARLIMLATCYFTSVGMITFLKEVTYPFLPHHGVARNADFWESDCRIQCIDACYPQSRTPSTWRPIVSLVSACHCDTNAGILLQSVSGFIHSADLQSSFTFPGLPPSATAATNPLSSMLQRIVWVLVVLQVLYVDWETTMGFWQILWLLLFYEHGDW
jgi:hypothetical protein